MTRTAAAPATPSRRPARPERWGPNLDDLAASAKKANQGSLAQYTLSSIVDPNSYIVPGYPASVMPPTFGQKLSKQAARRPRRLPHQGLLNLQLPADFPREVEVVATDLDRTLMWEDNVLRPRTLAALRRAEEVGLRVIVCTGRMVQSARRVLAPAESRQPLVCYQGAAVVDADGTWLLHVPLELPLALEAIDAVEAEGYGLNVYVDDELYVAEVTPEAQALLRVPAHLAAHGGRPPRVARPAADEARLHRRPGRARRPRREDARALRRAALDHEVASVLPRVRDRGRVEGLGARVPRRPARLRAGAHRHARGRRERPRPRGVGLRHRGRECRPAGEGARALGLPAGGGGGRGCRDRGACKLEGYDRPPRRTRRSRRVSARRSRARAPPSGSTRCSRRTSAGGRCCRASRSCARS